jgi:hypothetical protein
MSGVLTSPRLQSSKASKEEGLRPEIQQHDVVRKVEEPLSHEHSFKQESQAKEKRRE